jgi:signal transduction histidine kinase
MAVAQIRHHARDELERVGGGFRVAAPTAELLRRVVSEDTRRLLPLLAPVAVAGTAVVAIAVWHLATSDLDGRWLAGTLGLLGAATIAEAFPVPLETIAVGRMSLASIFIIGASAIYGTSTGVLVGFVAMSVVELARRRPASRVSFNAALYSLAAAVAGGAASLVDGTDVGALALRAVLASAGFYVVDIALLAAVIARATRRPLLHVLGRYVYSTALPFAIITSLVVILIVLWDRSPFVALLLAGPLLAIALYQRWIHGALEQLRELDSLKDDVIVVVSHDLRTPIASVYGAAVTLQRSDLDDDERRTLLGIVYQQAARLAHLVDQVLTASRPTSEPPDGAVERFDPGALARDVVEDARSDLPPTLTLELGAAEPTRPVTGHPEKLRQVLANLVENAVKYSPDGGRIAVTYESANGHLRFSVRDEGLGVPSEEQGRIFEKFHRVDPYLTRGVGGTGLGLYICRKLVGEMGGRIWVDSEEGRGSTFSFELPAAPS